MSNIINDNEGLVLSCFTDKNKEQDKARESSIQERLKKEHGGGIEVPTKVGRIDLLTSTEIIEIKQVYQWKNALGQVLAYGNYYPFHQKRLYLFGSCKAQEYIELIKENCKKLGVEVTWEGEIDPRATSSRSLKKAQQKYESSEKGLSRQEKYNSSDKGRARKRKWAENMSDEQREKQREAKRIAARNWRAKQKGKKEQPSELS